MDIRTRLHGRRRRPNPLRRRSDVVEAWVVALVVVLLCVVAPLAGTAAGLYTYDRARAHAEEQRAERHAVRAVVLGRPAAVPTVRGDRGHAYRAEVRWAEAGPEPEQQKRIAVAPVPAGTRAGDTVTVWFDDRGRTVAPPPNDVAVWQHTVAVGLGVAGGTAAIVLLARAMERRVALRHRLAEWERAWARTGPRWTRRRA
ncbi:hypothetical protein ACGFZR_05600 [Streptomyces sp. NPDC048241]|uniref:Rv1733c family protein n=1 Tax=Streptomyces sp. NPDC048241 TaxID=3365521 RepID=UPI00371F2E20